MKLDDAKKSLYIHIQQWARVFDGGKFDRAFLNEKSELLRQSQFSEEEWNWVLGI